jgi:hypothetical protein
LKWLLITTLGTNPGDEFARIGVQNLIREVDKGAEFDLLNKENPEHYCPRDFDRAVICGMPLFWATEQDNYDIWWWDKIFEDWIAKDRRKLMALGVGHVLLDDIPNFAKYVFSINYVIQKVWKLTTREPVFDHPQIIESICPSAFAIRQGLGHKRLCNFMMDGGHFAHAASEKETKAWMSKQQTIFATLWNAGFDFVAHTRGERLLAHDLGWSDSRIHHYEKPEDYLELYSNAAQYFGHRLHGAAVVAARGAPSWGIAYDSRVKMVRRLGGWACRPSEFSIDEFRDWINGAYAWIPQGAFDLRAEKHRLVNLLKEFAS